jgi:hypothetical protein
MACWQLLDVSDVNVVNLSADGVTAADLAGSYSEATVTIGLSADPGSANAMNSSNNNQDSENAVNDSYIANAFIEWGPGETATKDLTNIDVSEYDEVYVVIKSRIDHGFNSPQTNKALNTIDNIHVVNPDATLELTTEPGFEVNSSTWNTYKSHTPSENSIDDYRYEQHWLNPNERYGLDPAHAQINGSFYIDQRLGRIHFSSNINGKTVILDYISDSLGTDAEMQVPKLAEDAMYKHILYDIISTRSNVGGGRLAFHKKEKFAAVRKAKLRLSNIKIEELTQILRGQSKQIKH